MSRILTAVRVIEARARLWPHMFPTSIHRTALALASMRVGVHVEAKPRRWRKVGPHEYTLRMGPVMVEVFRWRLSAPASRADEWGYKAIASDGDHRPVILRGHHVDKGAPLAQCQANAIAAVEAWRDSIR